MGSSRPWETAGFGIMGAYGLNKLDELEQGSKAKFKAEMTKKLERNRDAMDDTYQGVLGDNYSKWFGPKMVRRAYFIVYACAAVKTQTPCVACGVRTCSVYRQSSIFSHVQCVYIDAAVGAFLVSKPPHTK